MDLEKLGAKIINSLSFDENGILKPQRIKKMWCAYFYGVTPRTFRKEIENFSDATPFVSYYTDSDVAVFIKELGLITIENVKSAIPRIAEQIRKNKEHTRKYNLK